jgi:hypothetical protein
MPSICNMHWTSSERRARLDPITERQDCNLGLDVVPVGDEVAAHRHPAGRSAAIRSLRDAALHWTTANE